MRSRWRALRSTFDLEGYLREKDFDSNSDGSEWIGDCPACGKRKMCVAPERKVWHCWVCQEKETVRVDGIIRQRCIRGGGGLVQLVAWLEGVDQAEAARWLGRRVSVSRLKAKKVELKPPREVIIETPRYNSVEPPENSARLTTLPPYLQQRGLTMAQVEQFGLWWCPEGRFANRVIFPVTQGNNLIYWQARAMYEGAGERFIKALNSSRPKDHHGNPLPGFATSADVLMNLDKASQYPRVAVVEGPMDLVRTGPDAVCTFGKQFHPGQVVALLDAGVTAIDLCWDADAYADMQRVAPDLSVFFDVRLVQLPSGDPADIGPEGMSWYRERAMPAEGWS